MAPPDLVILAFSRAHAWVYRQTAGRIGRDKGRDVLLLSTAGRKSGRPCTTRLVYLDDDGTLVAAASNAGRERDPGWVHNLRADPRAEVTRGSRTEACAARFATREEAQTLWRRLVEYSPGFARYRERSSRAFPVVLLTPTAQDGEESG